MTPIEVFQTDQEASAACDASVAIHQAVITQAKTPSHAIASIFVAFVVACKTGNVDPHHEFEKLIAFFEDRQEATNRGSAAVN